MANKQGLGLRPKLISIAVASCFVTGTALANPTGPTVVNGTAAIVQNGNLLQITNSPNAILNWQSFSIGANEITRFIQQSQASAVLNRVVGSGGAIDPSVILGALQSNGRVFLINPSGIMFGAGAQVDVAGLVATSLNLSNADFLANRLKFSEVAGAGSVVNQGSITTGSGGQVYLVGSAVTNNGIITSPQGEVVLAAGNSVELVSPGTPNLRVEITAPDNQAINLGQIVADSGRIGIYAGLIKNSGTISASSVVNEGGKILLKATKSATLESTSILDASGNGGGTIEVLSKNGGTVNVAGRLDASAPVSGNGGFIETSADNVSVAAGTTVTTSAANGRTGLWLIDPTNFSINAGYGGQTMSSIGADTLSANLNSTSVTISTDSAPSGSELGDIYVNAPVSWSSFVPGGTSLSLIAHNDITVGADLTASGYGGSISLFAGWDGTSSTSAPVFSNPGTKGTINVNAPISVVTSIGSGPAGVSLKAGKDVVVNSNINVNNASGGFSNVTMQAGNSISVTEATIAASGTGGTITLNAGNDINLTSAALNASGTYGSVMLEAAHDIFIDASVVSANGTSGGTTWVDMNADNTVTIRNESNVSAYGSNYVYVDVSAGNGITVDLSTISAQSTLSSAYVSLWTENPNADIKIQNNSSISATAYYSAGVGVYADGGEGLVPSTSKITVADSYISANSTYSTASIDLYADGAGIYIDNSSLSASSGSGDAYIDLIAYGPSSEISVINNSSINANGYYEANVTLLADGNADGGEGFSSSAGKIKIENSSITANSYYYEANVSLSAGSGGITVDGGEGIYAQSSQDNASISLMSTGTIKVGMGTAGGTTIRADGAEGASVGLMALGNIDVKGSTLHAEHSDNDFNTANVSLWSYGGNITLDNATIHAYAPAYESEANVSLMAAGSIELKNNTSIEAYADESYGVAFVGMQAGGAISLTSSTVEAVADGGGGLAIVGFTAGTDITLTGGEVLATTQNDTDGPTLVGMLASNNITIAGNVTSMGLSFDGCEGCGQGWFNPYIPTSILNTLPEGQYSNFTGIAMQAGNKIIGSTAGAVDGILSAPLYQAIALKAANGIGTQALPVRINDGTDATGPEIFLENVGSTGDIAVSFATGDIVINNDVYGIFNNNPTGTFFINVEAGGFELNAPFKPGFDPGVDLGSQSLVVTASGDVFINSGASIVTTTGSTSLIGTNVVQSGGNISGLLNASATTGVVELEQAGNYTLGVVSSPVAVSVISTGGAILDGNSIVNVVAPEAYLSAASGIGTLANPLETQTPSLSLVAYGGDIGIINHGDFSLDSLSFTSPSGTAAVYASTQFGAATGTLTVGNPISTTGNLTLLGDTNVLVSSSVSTSGALTVQAGTGDVTVSGGISGSGGAITVLAGHDVVNSSSLTNTTGSISLGAGHDILNSGGISNASGNVFASAGNNVTLSGGIISGNTIGMSAGNTLGVTGATLNGTTVSLSAPILNIGSSVNASGDLLLVGNTVTVMGSAVAGNVAGVAADTLNVTGGLVQGFDVDMTIGSMINVSSGGRIVAVSANSIDILFPLLATGGITVNGVNGVVDPGDSGTGFFVPAGTQVTSLAQAGFNLTYGTSELPPEVLIAVNQVISTTNQQSTMTDEDEKQAQQQTGQTSTTEGEKDKKALPICK